MRWQRTTRLLLLSDACTDELQGALRDGWRIIAVCPQPSQRRPDYVLGRYNHGEVIDMAKRRSEPVPLPVVRVKQEP